MKLFRTILASVLIAGSAASADTINFEDVAISATNTYEVSQFDPMLGTLNSVELVFGVAVSNFAEKTFALGEDIFLETSAFVEITVAGMTDSVGGFDRISSGPCGVPTGCQEFVSVPPLPVAIFSNLDARFDDLSGFIGTGDIVGQVVALEGFLEGGSLRVSYDFEPTAIPLPASAPLLIAALGAFGFWRRRR